MKPATRVEMRMANGTGQADNAFGAYSYRLGSGQKGGCIAVRCTAGIAAGVGQVRGVKVCSAYWGIA